MKMKNNILFILYTVLIGIITGSIIWIFFKLMNLGIYFLWEFMPIMLKIPFYTIIICLIGGI